MSTLTNSVDTTSTISLKEQLKAIAFNIPGSFVPCVHNAKGQKPPVKNAEGKWVKGLIKFDNLDEYDFKCLGLLLGHEYLAIDADGKTSINFLNSLLQTYGELPDTLKLSSNPGTREAYIFKITKPLTHKTFPTGKKEQLEFRTGSHYQIIGGLHPSGIAYLTNNQPILELPEAWYDYLTNTLDSFVPETAEQMSMWTLLEQLRKAEPFFGVDYESWVKVGMIVHSVDSTEKGLELWSTWSKKFENYSDTDDDVYSKKWDNFDSEKLNGLTVGSLHYFLNGKVTLTDEVETLVKQLDEVVTKGITGLLDKEANNYKAMALTREQIPMIASKIVSQVLKFNDKHYVDYVISYLSEDVITAEDIAVTRKSLESLYKADKAGLDVDWILQDTRISYGLCSYAEFYNIPKEYLLMSFLTTYSTILSKNFRYNFNLGSDTIPTLFTLFIGEATSGKSEIVKPFVNPLMKIATVKNNDYIRATKQYQVELENWKKLSKDQQNEMYLQCIGAYEVSEDVKASAKRDICVPEPLKSNPMVVTDASFEAMKKQSGEFTDYGLLIATDEVTDFLQNVNRISKQSDGLDKLIAVWNGETTLRNRIGGEAEYADFFQVGLLSGVQTDRFSQFFNVHDPSGILSRFLMIPINQIHLPTRVNNENDAPILSEIAAQLFEESQQKINFGNNEKRYVVKHTEAVLNLWGDWRKAQDDRAEVVKEVNKGFMQWLRRNPVYTARIALVIHSMRFVEGLEDDLSVMSVESMKRAIAVSKWLTEKAQIIFNQGLVENLEAVDPDKIKIFKDVLKACKGETKKIGFFSQHSLGKRKDVLSFYGLKGQMRITKPGIVAMFKDVSKHGLGSFDTNTGLFIPCTWFEPS